MTRDEMIAHLVLLGYTPIKLVPHGYTWIAKPENRLANLCAGEWEDVMMIVLRDVLFLTLSMQQHPPSD